MTAVVPLAKLRTRGWTMQFAAVMISVFIIKDILFYILKYTHLVVRRGVTHHGTMLLMDVQYVTMGIIRISLKL